MRARFGGKPEFVENFFRFIAEDIRKYLAQLGFRTIDEAVGHAELLDTADGVAHWKSKGLDLSRLFAVPGDAPGEVPERRRVREQDHGLDQALDQLWVALAEGAPQDAHPVVLELPVRNVNRTVGTLLGSEVTGATGHRACRPTPSPSGSPGSAGQSLGAFLPPGIAIDLVGDANDYVGKGTLGRADRGASTRRRAVPAEDNVIAGNT